MLHLALIMRETRSFPSVFKVEVEEMNPEVLQPRFVKMANNHKFIRCDGREMNLFTHAPLMFTPQASASAQMWASTHNDTLKEKMSALVSALSACQYKMGTGYLSAFPPELFDCFEAIKPVWAPYYTIHKILAGLLDQHIFANNDQALKMVTWMVDYFYKLFRM